LERKYATMERRMIPETTSTALPRVRFIVPDLRPSA
jgi:hypothetical protein